MLYIILKLSSILIFVNNNIPKIPNGQVFTAILKESDAKNGFTLSVPYPCDDRERQLGINSGWVGFKKFFEQVIVRFHSFPFEKILKLFLVQINAVIDARVRHTIFNMAKPFSCNFFLESL